MLIAIPVANNKLDIHFGHCKKFALMKINIKEKKFSSREDVAARLINLAYFHHG